MSGAGVLHDVITFLPYHLRRRSGARSSSGRSCRTRRAARTLAAGRARATNLPPPPQSSRRLRLSVA